jgi:GMP synthase-like glutamine amidotransferase
LPDIKDIDWLIVMGGPMSAGDEEEFPWLKAEKALIKQAIDDGIPVLGICLGAQLVAETLGAKVFRNPVKEVGWFPVHLTESGRSSPYFAGFGRSFEAFHWHGDTFDLPAGAVQLASTEGCKNQAFSWMGHVLGLQFHLDTNAEAVRSLVRHCSADLAPGPFVQTRDEIMRDPNRYERINLLLSSLLDAMDYTHAERTHR